MIHAVPPRAPCQRWRPGLGPSGAEDRQARDRRARGSPDRRAGSDRRGELEAARPALLETLELLNARLPESHRLQFLSGADRGVPAILLVDRLTGTVLRACSTEESEQLAGRLARGCLLVDERM